MSDERLLSAEIGQEDSALDVSLRPKRLEDYVGQDQVKDNLRVFIKAALMRSEPLDHVLLYGPPGLGKTTLAGIIAEEMGSTMHNTSGPGLEKSGDLAAILTNLEEGDVLFIDEIHRLLPVLEETLYPAMEDYQLDIVVGQGPAARTMQLPLKRYTLVGATTRVGMLSSPLRARFGIVHHLEFYNHSELSSILHRSANLLNVPLENEGAEEISRRSRGTPRIANRLLKRVRDFAEVEGDGVVTGECAEGALTRLQVDTFGLDIVDRRYLLTIAEKFRGGPVGIQTLAAAIGEDRDTLEEVVEPYLMKIGFLDRTPRGRCLTKTAMDHLHVNPGSGNQPPLF